MRTRLIILNLLFPCIVLLTYGCADKKTDTAVCCGEHIPARLAPMPDTSAIAPGAVSHAGMVYIPAGEFMMGATDTEGRGDEYPQHRVQLHGFWIDITEVTNAQFRRFVEATGYITTAEKTPDWEEMKKQLPPGTPKPDDSLLVAASLVFSPPGHTVSLQDPSQWWIWKKGADWKHPGGPGTGITGIDNHPVVHISWY
ncbi:MAG TPA: SUMF1/EgtB/PvdO family nonheme iron enzyme, partial [Ferruginibacter sp.]|nr:SUMF1/EgtB/PvdO family nonheme iron enzyme [Ferruginibacter sp.]